MAFNKILESFERISGQRINLDKSMVYFSPNTPGPQREILSRLLKMKVVTNLDAYLGLPIPIGKKKHNAFKSILDHTVNRINDSQRDYYPVEGKEQNRSWHMLSWDCMCFPKGMRGLGFRDLRRFNVAFLGWQVWHLMSCKDTLCFRVLSAKYFSDGDVLHPKHIDKPSFTWQSIAKAARLSGASIGLNRWEIQENNVCDLLNNEKDGWNESRIFEIYGEHLGDRICKIPLIHNSPDNYRIWFHNPLGYYSTKSTYSWLTLKHVGFGPHRIFWRLTWKLQTLPKIRIFCWSLGHDILPTYEKISGIRREVNGTYPRCEIDKETLIHAMKYCPRARAVLFYGSLNNKVLEGTYNRCVDCTEDVARTLGKKDFRIFNLLEKLMIPKPVIERGWRKPDQGVVKVNFDANTAGRKMSFGFVARDHDSFVLGGRGGVLEKNVQAEWAELHALEESISFAQAKNWTKLVFESNCMSLVNRLNKTKCCCNKPADYLCNWASMNNCTKDFNMDYPIEIHDIILSDAIN
ncbi:hypothetical protein CXB51_008257 [Gossypium anomalum]|uniref:RNase H type-1 domain-containing protein n=1 Tax=Gossypium anomalum TaxID=47600 RepID=A0A8J6DAF3_9ROSI|nr:hypothetical protein CXB51_008257 [Gossypium anomalum]